MALVAVMSTTISVVGRTFRAELLSPKSNVVYIQAPMSWRSMAENTHEIIQTGPRQTT